MTNFYLSSASAQTTLLVALFLTLILSLFLLLASYGRPLDLCGTVHLLILRYGGRSNTSKSAVPYKFVKYPERHTLLAVNLFFADGDFLNQLVQKLLVQRLRFMGMIGANLLRRFGRRERPKIKITIEERTDYLIR